MAVIELHTISPLLIAEVPSNQGELDQELALLEVTIKEAIERRQAIIDDIALWRCTRELGRALAAFLLMLKPTGPLGGRFFQLSSNHSLLGEFIKACEVLSENGAKKFLDEHGLVIFHGPGQDPMYDFEIRSNLMGSHKSEPR